MKITVNFLTFSPSIEHPRHAYAMTCLQSLLKKLTFGDGELRWHIADDGSAPEHRNALVALCRKAGVEPTVSDSDRHGYGGNVNLAAQAIHDYSDLVLACEEDWELVRPFDLSDLARAIGESNELRCVRLGYLGITSELTGKVINSAGQAFLLLNPDCSETFVFTGHPRLETVGYEQAIGAWPEGLKAGYTELEICARQEARTGVAWPLDAGVNASQDYVSLFAHIGSEQA